MTLQAPRRPDAFSLGVLIAVLIPGAAFAQSVNANSAAYNGGYGRVAGSENQPVNVQMGDGYGDLPLANGLVQTSVSGSVFTNLGVNAAASASASGVGSSSSSSEGSGASTFSSGGLTVVTTTQSNSDAASATDGSH